VSDLVSSKRSLRTNLTMNSHVTLVPLHHLLVLKKTLRKKRNQKRKIKKNSKPCRQRSQAQSARVLAAMNLSTFVPRLLYNNEINVACSVIGKAASSQGLDTKTPQAEAPEANPASPSTEQPKLRKWFRHKEQLSGSGVSP